MSNEIHIFYIKHTDKLSDTIFQKFLAQLPEYFQRDINAYKHWESAQSSLLGKVLLQYGFQYLQLPYVLSDIKISEKDRPFIDNNVHLQAASLVKDAALIHIDFNISHSGEYVICAISKNANVGIDIEKHRKLKMNIAERYFSNAECEAIKNATEPEQSFFDFWAVKESAIKCDGRGVEVLSRTHLLLPSNQTELTEKVMCAEKELFYSPVSIMETGYSCFVCSPHPFNLEIHQLQLTDLG